MGKKPVHEGYLLRSAAGGTRFPVSLRKNIPYHISESSETIVRVKILKFLDGDADPDPGSGNLFDPGSENGKNSDRDPGLNIPNPQHCMFSPSPQKLTIFCQIKGNSETEILFTFFPLLT
jgi:hypothetical protein